MVLVVLLLTCNRIKPAYCMTVLQRINKYTVTMTASAFTESLVMKEALNDLHKSCLKYKGNMFCVMAQVAVSFETPMAYKQDLQQQCHVWWNYNKHYSNLYSNPTLFVSIDSVLFVSLDHMLTTQLQSTLNSIASSSPSKSLSDWLRTQQFSRWLAVESSVLLSTEEHGGSR